MGVDRHYEGQCFVEHGRVPNMTPRVAQNTIHCSSAVDGRASRHAGYRITQAKCRRVDGYIGWLKAITEA